MMPELGQTTLKGVPLPIPRPRVPPLQRLRYQFIGALLLAVLLPVFVRWGFDLDGWLMEQQVNSILGSTVAILAGLVVLRQMEAYPGVRSTTYIVPAMALSFAVMLIVLLFGRVDYNRFLFPVSLVITIVWLYVTQLTGPRQKPHFLVVPGGGAAAVTSFGGARWTLLDAPPQRRLGCDGVVVDLGADLPPEMEGYIAECAVAGIRVFHVKQLQESLTGRVEIGHLSENTLGSLNPASFYLQLKQIADWLLAGVALVVLLPLGVVTAIAIRLDSPGPVFFVQTRMGFRGRPFRCFKFRTMVHDVRRANDTDEKGASTQPNDPRITRLGRLLRRSRIDELPQVINILLGEMSWIGPRPEAMTLSNWYEDKLPFYRYRHIVRPGISGWAQVNQGHVSAVADVREKLHYDFYYIKNFSLWLDLLIAFRTVRTVLSGFGAR